MPETKEHPTAYATLQEAALPDVEEFLRDECARFAGRLTDPLREALRDVYRKGLRDGFQQGVEAESKARDVQKADRP